MAKTWFITGASRGFGLTWATAALERGDSVAATIRTADALSGLAAAYPDRLLTLELDVRNRDAVFAGVKAAHEHFGTLDVIVHNAGYGHFGFAEEISQTEAEDQLDVNVLGQLWVTQAVLPYLREQGSGHLLYVSSMAGGTGIPSLSIYAASKWALEGLAQSIALEVAGFGIKTTIIEPGGYATDWAGSSARASAQLSDYAPTREQMAAMGGLPQFPSADATVHAMLTVVDADQPPLRQPLGAAAATSLIADAERRIADWRMAEELAGTADA